MKVSDAVDVTVDGEVAVITIDNPPVNALSPEVRDGIYAGVEAGIKDPKVQAILLTCAGRTFVAGGDIASMGKGKQAGAPVRTITALIEGSPKPVIASIQGAALGGGLEITLAAHWRVAEKSARCGLPEVKIGILPGAGGTQRLPRLVGAAKALDMIIFGEHITAPEALQIGVFDELLTTARRARAALPSPARWCAKTDR
jgi:3-hydroxyacyl-CoA dehydrogenase